MERLVEFPLESGGSVLVDVTGHHTGPVTRSLKGAEVVERARQTFEEAVGRVQPAVEGVIAQLRSLAEVPDEVHVEFGLDLHAEAGAFIAAVSTTANFTVALTWRRDPVSTQPQPGSNVSAVGGHGTR
jgi:Trypsin-co-occurring domain 1